MYKLLLMLDSFVVNQQTKVQRMFQLLQIAQLQCVPANLNVAKTSMTSAFLGL